MRTRMNGFTHAELLATLALTALLAAVLAPAAVRAANAGEGACANQLRQFGSIFRMYANETRGQFWPPAQRVFLQDGHASFGFDGASLYPDYWHNLGLKVCPADERDFAAEWGAEEGLEAALLDIHLHQRESGVADTAACQAALNALLSQRMSYVYFPYAAVTISQIVDAADCRIMWLDTHDHERETFEAGDLQACAPDLMALRAIEAVHVLEQDLPAAEIRERGGGWRVDYAAYWRDDDGSDLQDTRPIYARLRDGIERFFITDINNPGAGALAKSKLPVMWDGWSVENGGADEPGAMVFNHKPGHVPGGSNVLYMDGHVSFVRYQSAHPVQRLHSGEYPERVGTQAHRIMPAISGYE